MAVKGLTPQLAERGKIKIGERGEMKTSQGGKQFAQPRKLDHFLITTMQRDAAGRLMPDAALMARLKPEGGKITEIPVRLLYDDIDLNFPTRFAFYRGTRCWCSGDGEVAHRLTGENGKYQEVACSCERVDPLYAAPDKCKILGTLPAPFRSFQIFGFPDFFNGNLVFGLQLTYFMVKCKQKRR